MAAISFNPAVLGALGALRPLPPPQPPKPPSPTTLTTQDLAQGLFQRVLQTAAQLPVAEPITGGSTLTQEVTASLLAALTAPQAAANTSTVPTATTSPAPVQVVDPTTPAVTPPATPDLPAVQDGAALSATTDFALSTALRFGAGVAALAGPAVAAADFGSGLVRDAIGVLRTGPLEPRASHPGPEAFARPQPTGQMALLAYEGSGAPAQGIAGTLDLLA